MSTRKRTNQTDKEIKGKDSGGQRRSGSDTSAPGAGQNVNNPTHVKDKNKRRSDNLDRQDNPSFWPDNT